MEAVEGAPTAVPTSGDLIDERYRLEQIRTDHQIGRVHAVLWRARDGALDRPVAVLVVAGQTKTARRRLLAAASRASRIVDSRFVRVLDAGSDDDSADNVAWIVTEWVAAPSLAAVVRGDPLPAEVATEVVRQCADAIAVLERDGLHHGRLHPDQVLLPDQGLPRITGAEVAVALRGGEPTESDVVALGGLLFAALTGRSPLPGWSTLPGLDPRTARAARPRLVRAGISRELDEITHRAMTGGFSDAHLLARALGALPSRSLGAPVPPAEPTGPSAWQRWSWRLVPPAIVTAIGLTGWALGSDLGRVPGAARQHAAALPHAHHNGSSATGGKLVWRPNHPPTVSSFDPEGDGTENDAAAPLAVDQDTTTQWTSSVYRNNPRFGGLKSGVGLLLDMHHAVTADVAELALNAPGAGVEIRAGDQRPAQAADLPVVASTSKAKASVRLTFRKPVHARYWLVWFTSLPAVGSGYEVGVAEIELRG